MFNYLIPEYVDNKGDCSRLNHATFDIFNKILKVVGQRIYTCLATNSQWATIFMWIWQKLHTRH